MNINEILNQTATKTSKIKSLLALGLTRKEVATLMGVGYGFVQNVYAKEYGVANPRTGFAFSFDRSFGIEIEAFGPSIDSVVRAIRAKGIDCQSEHYNHTTRAHWKVVTDASVPGGFEVVSPVLQGDDGMEQLIRQLHQLLLRRRRSFLTETRCAQSLIGRSKQDSGL